jgi:hypothetical protein
MGMRLLVVSATNSLSFFSTSAAKHSQSGGFTSRSQAKQKENEIKSPPLRLTPTGTGTGTGPGTRSLRVPFPFAKPGRGTGVSDSESELVVPPASVRETATQVVLWAMEAVYILWLFLLPYAPVSF